MNDHDALPQSKPPQVKITYDVETGGTIEKRELPFVVAIFADLSGDRCDACDAGLGARRMQDIDIDSGSFNDVMARIKPSVNLRLVKRTLPKASPDEPDTLDATLSFQSLADFEPMAIVRALPPLHGLDRLDGDGALLDSQLREIMQAPNFRALEATWRGLAHLVSQVDTGKLLQLKVFDATKQELLDDMQKAPDRDQSHLFKILYEAMYGTYGGLPCSLLLGGYEIGYGASDIAFLGKMAELAAGFHAPFIAAASPALFGMDSFVNLDRPRSLEKIFESAELWSFHEFRQAEDARYVTLALPHFLLRPPYGADGAPLEDWAFAKHDSDAAAAGLWGNAAYLLAAHICRAFALYAWPAAICGIENAGARQRSCTTDTHISTVRAQELSYLGFMPLCFVEGSDTAVFTGGQTLHQPKRYFSAEANENAILSAQLAYILAASRFAHYIKLIMRDKIGSFLTRENVEAYLNTWIAQYVLSDEKAGEDVEACYPLSEGSVVVADVPQEPGAYKSVMFLRPRFQLEKLSVSIRLEVAN